MKNYFILINPDDKKILSGIMGDGMYFFIQFRNLVRVYITLNL